MPWTLFWDMHSGGGTKIPPYNKIYVEAPEDDARSYFQRRFERDPENVTCNCCGEDYSVYGNEPSLEQASGFHRNLRCVETKRDPETGRYITDDPNVRYLEEGEEPPPGYSASKRYGKPMTLDEYIAQPDVLIVRGDEVLKFLRSPHDQAKEK
jgi:hypothetical protein